MCYFVYLYTLNTLPSRLDSLVMNDRILFKTYNVLFIYMAANVRLKSNAFPGIFAS